VPVGATPERGEASGDLPVARKEELRGFLERSLTQGTDPWSAGEFGLSAGRFSLKSPSARAGSRRGSPCARAGRALLGRGGVRARALSSGGPRGLGRAVSLKFSFFESKSMWLMISCK
jgi:hypothetical protein